MKISIIGAGAMGCLYGAYLSRNHEVFMVDVMDSVVKSINEHGIIIREADGSEKCYTNHITAYASGACQEVADLIIMFVKSTYLESALEQNKTMFHENVIVVSLQNGAGNDRKIEKYVQRERIVIGTSKHNAVSAGAGIANHTGIGETTIGGDSGVTDILEEVAQALRVSQFDVMISDDIQKIIWSKLFINLSVNAFTAITQTPIGYMIKNEYAWNFAKRLVYEAVEVAEEDGTYFDRREVLNSVRKLCESMENGYSSMYQDRKRKQKTEIDVINGAIVEQAKQYGVPVPYNSLVVDLVHAIEGAYEFE